MTMIDTVVVPAIGSGYDEPRQLFTIDLNCGSSHRSFDEDLVAEGWSCNAAVRSCSATPRCAPASGTLAATGSLTYKVSSKPQTF